MLWPSQNIWTLKKDLIKRKNLRKNFWLWTLWWCPDKRKVSYKFHWKARQTEKEFWKIIAWFIVYFGHMVLVTNLPSPISICFLLRQCFQLQWASNYNFILFDQQSLFLWSAQSWEKDMNIADGTLVTSNLFMFFCTIFSYVICWWKLSKQTSY